MAYEPHLRHLGKPVTGTFKPRKGTRLERDEHHLGWDRALQNALDRINRPPGTYKANVNFWAVVEVTNPGSIIEYHADLS
jgi:hypothetical protein